MSEDILYYTDHLRADNRRRLADMLARLLPTGKAKAGTPKMTGKDHAMTTSDTDYRDQMPVIGEAACANPQRVDLQGVDLRCVDLKDADLRYANFWEADIQDMNFWEATPGDADIQDTDVTGTNFTGPWF